MDKIILKGSKQLKREHGGSQSRKVSRRKQTRTSTGALRRPSYRVHHSTVARLQPSG